MRSVGILRKEASGRKCRSIVSPFITPKQVQKLSRSCKFRVDGMHVLALNGLEIISTCHACSWQVRVLRGQFWSPEQAMAVGMRDTKRRAEVGHEQLPSWMGQLQPLSSDHAKRESATRAVMSTSKLSASVAVVSKPCFILQLL